MNIKLIGLCGRSGSGKGYVCAQFRRFGVPSVDTDAVYRELVGAGSACAECKAELRREFGDGIFLPDSSLDRRALAAIVFSPGAQQRLSALNSITHKYILAECLRRAAAYEAGGAHAVIIDAPLLFESGFDTMCDINICVTAPDDVCVRRICERDGINEYEAKRRLAAQKSADELRALCTCEIVNDGERDVYAQIQSLCDKYKI